MPGSDSGGNGGSKRQAGGAVQRGKSAFTTTSKGKLGKAEGNRSLRQTPRNEKMSPRQRYKMDQANKRFKKTAVLPNEYAPKRTRRGMRTA